VKIIVLAKVGHRIYSHAPVPLPIKQKDGPKHDLLDAI